MKILSQLELTDGRRCFKLRQLEVESRKSTKASFHNSSLAAHSFPESFKVLQVGLYLVCWIHEHFVLVLCIDQALL